MKFLIHSLLIAALVFFSSCARMQTKSISEPALEDCSLEPNTFGTDMMKPYGYLLKCEKFEPVWSKRNVKLLILYQKCDGPDLSKAIIDSVDPMIDELEIANIKFAFSEAKKCGIRMLNHDEYKDLVGIYTTSDLSYEVESFFSND